MLSNARHSQQILAYLVATLVCVLPATAGPEDEALQGIESLLSQMQVQVILADPAGYLELIDPSESEFNQEQTMWAADLEAHAPETFEIKVDGPVELDVSGAQCRVTMSWTMPEENPREVSYPARFTFAQNGWRYAGEVWSSHQIDKLDVLYIEDGLESVAQKVAAVFPDIRQHVDSVFITELDHLQTVKLYTSMRHLQASIYLSYKESLGGWNEPGESIKVLARTKSSKSGLRRLLAHEYGHVAMFAMGNHATKIPWWAQEGVAQLASEPYGTNAESIVRRWAKKDKLLDWSLMTDFRKTDPKNYGYVYNQGHHMVAFIREQWGGDAWVSWLQDMAQGNSLEQSTMNNLQLSFDQLNQKWRASLPEPEQKAPEDEPKDDA